MSLQTEENMKASLSGADKSKPFFPLAGLKQDGWSNEEEATATCFCGTVQLAFPVAGPGYKGSFVCNCYDCHKITASMFASNFMIADSDLKHIRGQDNLTVFKQAATMYNKGHSMANYFCKTCGTLMYRIGAEGFPGVKILRLGTVDDFNLMEGKLRPTLELFVKDRVDWLRPVQVEGIKRFENVSA